jgi:hypothetical protein
MKKLVISFDSYSWVKYVGGMIIENPDLFEVIIVCQDTDRDMDCCTRLCEDAIYAQRRYDLFRISKDIGLKKISNFNYTYSSLLDNFDKFVAEISLKTIVSGSDTIIYQNNYLLRNIAKNMCIKTFAYSDNYDLDNTKFIYLKNSTVDKKIALSRFMLGIHDKQERKLFPSVEQLYY